jgi:hypothetical protein
MRRRVPQDICIDPKGLAQALERKNSWLIIVAKPALEFTQLLELLHIPGTCESHVTAKRVRENSDPVWHLPHHCRGRSTRRLFRRWIRDGSEWQSDKWPRYCRQGSQKRSYGKGKPLREHTHHAGSFYEATADESSRAHQALSSFNRRDLEDLEPLLFARPAGIAFPTRSPAEGASDITGRSLNTRYFSSDHCN